jgi:3'-phosphoadenosine 5'-phosphosulfate sulfotransferase (PAPS reductase)/FAD synthetase
MTDNDDAERLRALKHRVDTDPAPATPTDEMWPAIRARIEAAKVEPLGSSAAPGRRRYGRWLALSLAVGAAAVILVALALRFEARRGGPQTITYTYTDTGVVFTMVSDSAKAYEDETRALLNDLELRRSMLRPEAVAAIDHDLLVVDSAIAEVKDALKNDPNNPALRRLLASSYREKLSVLHRVGNAG